MSGLEANKSLVENALGNISKSVVKIASTYNFGQFRKYPNYRSLSKNYNSISEVLTLHNELQSIRLHIDGIHSVFFHLENSDYIVSTNTGVALLPSPDIVSWIPERFKERNAIFGEWYPRKLEEGTPQYVVSYVLPLNQLTTSTRGTIVANLLESQIMEYLGSASGHDGEQITMLVGQDGSILSHPNKELIFSDAGDIPFVRELVSGSATSGYRYFFVDGERKLYTFTKSPDSGWIYIGMQSLNALVSRTDAVSRNMNIVMVAIILAGAFITAFLATWLTRPARNLVKTIKNSFELDAPVKNEFDFLSSTFQKIQVEGKSLRQRLKRHEQDTEHIFLLALLRGDIDNFMTQETVSAVFPMPRFIVAIIVLDGYRQYIGKTNAEMRMYHRFLFMPRCQEVFTETDGILAKCVYRGEGTFGLIINAKEGLEFDKVKPSLEIIRESAKEITGHTVTIGVSEGCDSFRNIYVRAAEALDTTKRRIVYGGNNVVRWRPEYGYNKKYTYPSNCEQHIVNHLIAGNLDSIKKELADIRALILSAENIPYDNILFIYHQIVGAAIKHLGENNIGTGRIFAYRGNVYAAISSFDTILEIEEYLIEFFDETLSYLNRRENQSEPSQQDNILNYLREHYHEDIMFEDVAEKIGVSYSHMRKLVREVTGKSVSDYVNALRVNEAKRLLRETSLSVAQIAEEAGYRNVQSLNRFFRKIEGMSPSEYRTMEQM